MNKLFNNEKHYLTLNNYLKDRFNEKVFKVALDGGFTCPNRDGTISFGGCTYCSEKGSGDFAGKRELSIPDQFKEVSKIIEQKWPNGSYIAYFQAFSNTYDTVENLKKRYDAIIDEKGHKLNDKIKILSIATRPDCLNDNVLAYLKKLAKRIELWVELGFQTANETTGILINRGYNNDVFLKAVNDLNSIGAKVIVHIINGLPNDTKDDMLNTANFLSKLPIDGIKIHMLHVIKDSVLGASYEKMPFSILSLEEYVEIVATQLTLLPDNLVIHRVTGDAVKENLLAPTWTLKKFVVMNEIDKYMRKNNLYQGDHYVKDC